MIVLMLWLLINQQREHKHADHKADFIGYRRTGWEGQPDSYRKIEIEVWGGGGSERGGE